MQLSTDFLHAPGVKTLAKAFCNHQLYFVGGCVRDALLHRRIVDMDLASDATPDEMGALAGRAGLRIIPTGREHGTMTFVIDGTPYQVTTFRKDIRTDGRHAQVMFGASLIEDAQRRDFTMNALYLSIDGKLVDPVGGAPDALAGCVRFIGDAHTRIREDYLRIVRFFRFQAYYGEAANGINAQAFAACAELADGLGHLSAERITAEMQKLFSAPDPTMAVGAMAASGILHRLLPGADVNPLIRLIALETAEAMAPCAVMRLVALGGNEADLRLSRKDRQTLSLLQHDLADATPLAELAFRHGADHARHVALLRAAVLDAPLPHNLVDQIAWGAQAHYPLKASDLMPAVTGAALGAALHRLERLWIDSNFSLDKTALLKNFENTRREDKPPLISKERPKPR